jgi:Protein kinase domain
MKALAPHDPRVIGEYRLRAQLGAGGMGRVYLGLSPAGRAVAVKVVYPELAQNSDFRRRFAQEVASARAVSGIYTAPVVSSGLNEDPPWLATAFVPGPELDQLVSEHGPLPEAALWPLLAGLSEALAAIHAAGVVHRDLKPANVLMATDGPRVIDFGISRAIDGTVLTAAGEVFGTPGYMSPEQAEGKPAGPASDVFALGCVITYAATGAGPFGTGTAAAVLYRVVHGQATLDRVPPALRDIVSGCLAKDPAARPVPAALAAALAGQDRGTGPSAVAFWPRAVADVIGAYQAQVLQETREQGRLAEVYSASGGTHEATEVAWPAQPPRPDPGSPGAPARPGPPGDPDPQSYPRPRGYPEAQDYSSPPGSPPPQGYRRAASPGSPAAPPASSPQPGRAGRAVLVPLPASMRRAIGLMYAGAAAALVYAIGVVIVASAIIAKHPGATAARASSGQLTVGGVAILAAVAALIEIALWLGIARACRNGRSGARVAGTVLFGLHTIGLLAVLGSKHPGLGLTKILTLLSWFIACGAVVYLWQRPSSAFFTKAAGRPS